MVLLNKKNYNLIISFFFLCTSIINTTYGVFIKDFPGVFQLLVINLSFSLIFLFLHKLNKFPIEMTISLILLSWAIFRMIYYKGDFIEYSIMVSYSIMLILKKTKIKPLPIIFLSALMFVVCVSIMIINEGNIARLVNNMTLVVLICIGHFLIYHNEYKEKKEPPNIKKIYNLNDIDIIILDSLFLPDPCLKTIQDYVLSKKKHCSNTYVKDRLQQLYKIFKVAKGGSRKTELLGKIIRLGYKI